MFREIAVKENSKRKGHASFLFDTTAKQNQNMVVSLTDISDLFTDIRLKVRGSFNLLLISEMALTAF